MVASLIGGLLTTMLLVWLNNQANKKVRTIPNGMFELRLNKFYLYMGVFSILIGIAIVSLVFVSEDIIDLWILVSLCILLFVGLGLYSVLWYRNHYFLFDSKRIESVNLLGKKESLLWENVVSIKFKVLKGVLVFKNKNGLKVEAHQHLIGFGQLLEAIETHTHWEAKDFKIPYR